MQREVLRFQERHQERAPVDLWKLFHRKSRLARKHIRRHRWQTHHQKVAEASGDLGKVWKLSKRARDGAPFQAFRPHIKGPEGLCFQPEQKSQALSDSFLPPPPAADLQGIHNFVYNECRKQFPLRTHMSCFPTRGRYYANPDMDLSVINHIIGIDFSLPGRFYV